MANQPLQPIPYLHFDGTCAEAFKDYARIFGATITNQLTYGEMPGDWVCPEEFKSRIVNIQLTLPGGNQIYGGDSQPSMQGVKMSGFMIALNFDDMAEGKTAFGNLAEGGEIQMELAPTFWSELFGMCTDRFGVDWCVNVGLK